MRRAMAVIVGLSLSGTLAAAQECVLDPNHIKVGGMVQNRYGASTTPNVIWDPNDCPAGGTQSAWNVEVDNRADFHGCDPDAAQNTPEYQSCLNLWYWNGIDPTETATSAYNVPWATGHVGPPSDPNDDRPIDGRLNLAFFRVRVKWNGLWGPWAETQYKYYSVPSAPADVALVANQTTNGTTPFYPFPAIVSGNEYFVDAAVASDAQDCGPVAAPCKTITYLLNPSNHPSFTIQAGDTITVREGTYQEQVDIGTGSPSGDRTNPITLRADPAAPPGSVILEGSASSSPFTLHLAQKYWRIVGLRFSVTGTPGSGSTYRLIDLYGAEATTVDGVSFGTTPSSPGDKRTTLLYVKSPTDPNTKDSTRIMNSVFDKPVFDQIDIAGARYVVIRNNEFTGLNSDASGSNHVNVHIHSGGNQGVVVESNVFHDSHLGGEGALMLYLGSGAGTVRNNVFYGLTDPTSGVGSAIMVMRSGKVTVENNTIYDVPRGIAMIDNSRRMIIRNNIVAGASVAAFDFSQTSVCDGCGTAGTILGYNLTWMNATDFYYDPNNTQLDQNLIENPSFQGGNPEIATNYFNEDPHFSDPGAGDFTISANSPAKDAGDPDTPVPAGGGTTRDIGAKERGASEPYQYQVHYTTDDTTPRLTWSFQDPDNWLRDFDAENVMPPVMEDDPRVDFQVDFEVQFDTVPTFDSVNGMHPLYSTAPDGHTVNEPCPGSACYADPWYDVPEIGGPPPGQYYVRVRTRPRWGDPALWGAWSDSTLRIEITEPQGGGGGGGGGGCNPPKCFPGH